MSSVASSHYIPHTAGGQGDRPSIERAGDETGRDVVRYLRSWAHVLSVHGEPAIVLDRNGWVRWYNRHAESLFPMLRSSRCTVAQLAATTSLDEGGLRAAIRRVLEKGTWSGHGTIYRPDRMQRVLIKITMLPGQRKAAGMGVLISHGDRENHAPEIAADERDVAAFFDELLRNCTEEEPDIGALAELVGTSLGADQAYLVSVDPTRPPGDVRSAKCGGWRRDAGIIRSIAKDEVERLRSSAGERPNQLQYVMPVVTTRGDVYGEIVALFKKREGRSFHHASRLLGVFSRMLAAFLEGLHIFRMQGESSQRWERLVEAHPDPIIVLRDVAITYANPAATALLGARGAAEFHGRSMLDFASSHTRDALEGLIREVERDEVAQGLECELHALDGRHLITDVRATATIFAGASGVQLIIRDLTEKKKSEERFRNWFHTIAEGMWCIALERPVSEGAPESVQIEQILAHGRVDECNPPMAALLGGSPEDVTGRRIADFPIFQDLVGQFVAGRLKLDKWQHAVAREESTLYLISSARGVLEHDDLVRIWGSCLDVSRSVDAERNLIRAVEAHQQRVAYELHDNLGQLLTAMRLLSYSMYEDLSHVLSPELDAQMKQLASVTDDAVFALRSIYGQLTPSDLLKGGSITAAVQDVVATIRQLSDVYVTFAVEGDPEVLDQDSKIHAFRIIQESLNNAVKHSRAKSIAVMIEHNTESNTIEFSVSDAGVGFDVANVKTKSLGIESLYRRARIIGGDLKIISAPGDGTTVRCSIPV